MTDTGGTVTASSEKLSFWTKAAYAIGDLGESVGPGTIIPFWYLYFLTDVAKLNPALAGMAILMGKIWDAFNDPLMGALTDRTRSRWGRRRPYLLFGALPFGVSFALLWYVPPIQNQILLCLYFALVYMIFDTAFTLIACPYNALIPELTMDHDERTSLVTYRMFVSILAGLIIAVLLGEVIFPMYPDNEKSAFMMVGIICGATFVIPIWITFLGTREREAFQAEKTPGFMESIRYVLRNREYRYTLTLYLLSWLTVDAAAALFPFFLIYWSGMSPGDSTLVLGVILGSAVIFLPLVLWLSNRLEKKTAYIIATASWAAAMLSILLAPQGNTAFAFVVAALSGFGVASAHLLPSAMLPDAIEVDELMSGKRQEGIYSGINVFAQKLATGIVLGIIGPLLAWSGYVEGAEIQAETAITTIRFLMGLLPAFLLIVACVVAWFYPLTRKRHTEILEALALRRSRKKSDGKEKNT